HAGAGTFRLEIHLKVVQPAAERYGGPPMRIGFLLLAALVAAIPAPAHSWYPLSCCGNMDWFPVACDQLVETVSGWLYVPTGNLFNREQVQPSRNQHCHACLGLHSGHLQQTRPVPAALSRRWPGQAR